MKIPLVIQELTKGPKSIARVVDLGEGRDPGEWVEGGDIRPRAGKDRLRTERVIKPPQPKGLGGI